MSAELDRLDALIDQQERAVRRAFREYVAIVGTAGPVLNAILEKLEARDPEGALAIVESYIVRFGNVLPTVAAAVGNATADELSALLPDIPIGIGFDPSHPRAAEIIRENRLAFVQDFSAKQRKAVVQALSRAYREGLGTQETARAFRASIGLVPQQENALANYRAQLRTLDRKALDGATRDRRFDRTVTNAIRRHRPLTQKQIEMMVERRRGQMLILRSKTIARTEGVRATSQAREEALDQMVEQTGIEPDRVVRVWNSTRDSRVRDWHATMNGQRRERNVPFVDGHGSRLMYPGDPAAPPETTINCRCGLTFSILPAG